MCQPAWLFDGAPLFRLLDISQSAAACSLQVKANSRALGARLIKYGYKLVTDGTDNHLVLWDMRKEV